MTMPRELEQTIANLPLSEREMLLSALEQSIATEHNHITEASVAEDVKRSEQILARHPFITHQLHELQARVEAAERGEAGYVPWDRVRKNVLAKLQRNE